MKRIQKPINTTRDGNAFTIVTKYEARAYLKSMTGGGGYYPCTGVLEEIEYEDGQDDMREQQGGREAAEP